jgi:hypothetical protein
MKASRLGVSAAAFGEEFRRTETTSGFMQAGAPGYQAKDTLYPFGFGLSY